MRRAMVWAGGALLAVVVVLCAGERTVAAKLQAVAMQVVRVRVMLYAPDKLELHSVKTEAVTYRGRKALQVTDAAGDAAGDDVSRIAVVKDVVVKDGTVELKLTGDTVPGAPATYRGFVGVAFRVNADATRYECLYLRPKNGRAADPVQRSHATQYISVPGYPWQKLREETPGRYESSVDIVPGEWIDVKIVFAGTEAKLYVNGATEPTLVVHDLKQPVAPGRVALWVGPGTVAHFAEMQVNLP